MQLESEIDDKEKWFEKADNETKSLRSEESAGTCGPVYVEIEQVAESTESPKLGTMMWQNIQAPCLKTYKPNNNTESMESKESERMSGTKVVFYARSRSKKEVFISPMQ